MKTLWQRILKLARSLVSEKQPLPPAIKAIPPAERIPSEVRLLNMYHMGETEGYQRGYQKAVEDTTHKRLNAVVYIDPAKSGAYEQPSPTTDPALQRRLEAQKRKDDMKKFLHVNTLELPKVSGDMVRKYTTQKLKPVTLENTPRDVAPDEKWIV